MSITPTQSHSVASPAGAARATLRGRPMPEFVEVARVAELPVGRVKACTVGDRTVALYHTAAGFFATDNTCPHRGGPLSEGDLIENEITCPWHLWGFDVVTGRCAGNPEVSVTAHEVRVERDRVLVRLL